MATYKGTITNKSKKADIIQWCKDNDKVEWLKAVSKETREVKVFPRVPGVDGKLVVDKSAAPTIVEKPMTYLAIKRRIMNEFFSDDKKKKTSTFLEEIEAL